MLSAAPSLPPIYGRSSFLSLFLALVFFGLGLLAMLPPFEGSDETAHFSRIQSTAFAPQVTMLKPDDTGASKSAHNISLDVFQYHHVAPMPAGWILFKPAHEFDPDPILMTYAEFFRDPTRFDVYRHDYRDTPLPVRFQPSPEPNWQYQHPGLYYGLMAIPMRLLAGHVGLLPTMFSLRVISFILAMAGFGAGAWGSFIHLRARGWVKVERITMLGLLYPFMMPVFFWEFARLGNDSLCLCLTGIAWAMLLWILRNPREDGWLFLGLSLGFGCFAKALMVPVAFGLYLFLLVHRLIVARPPDTSRRVGWMPLIKSVAVFAVMAAPIYGVNFMQHGAIGADEFSIAMHKPDALGIVADHLNLSALRSGLQQVFFIMIWLFGSMSASIIDLPVHKALYILTAIIFVAYGIAARKTKSLEAWLPLFVLMPMLAGLLTHIVVAWIVGNTFTPGWYMHIAAPAFALIYGLALNALLANRWTRLVTMAGIAAVIAFNFMIALSMMTEFAGCAAPERHETSMMSTISWLEPQAILSCLTQPTLLMQHLSVLAYPVLALIGFGLSMLLLGFGLISWRRAS